jgi:hypothetical protein
MNKTISFALMVAAVAAVAVGTTAVMSPMSAHAAKPQYCFSNGDGTGLTCFPSQEQCEAAATHDQHCKRNRA